MRKKQQGKQQERHIYCTEYSRDVVLVIRSMPRTFRGVESRVAPIFCFSSDGAADEEGLPDLVGFLLL